MSKCSSRIDWYKVLYHTGDDRLIKYFWKWYNTHKVKSKLRAARFVLHHYYSTIAVAPDFVLDCFRWYDDARVVKFNIWDDDVELNYE